jgi:hypothetical protein
MLGREVIAAISRAEEWVAASIASIVLQTNETADRSFPEMTRAVEDAGCRFAEAALAAPTVASEVVRQLRRESAHWLQLLVEMRALPPGALPGFVVEEMTEAEVRAYAQTAMRRVHELMPLEAQRLSAVHEPGEGTIRGWMSLLARVRELGGLPDREGGPADETCVAWRELTGSEADRLIAELQCSSETAPAWRVFESAADGPVVVRRCDPPADRDALCRSWEVRNWVARSRGHPMAGAAELLRALRSPGGPVSVGEISAGKAEGSLFFEASDARLLGFVVKSLSHDLDIAR